MSRPELDAEDRAYLEQSRERSGVPYRVRDRRTIAQIDSLIRNSRTERRDAPGRDDDAREEER